MPTSNFQPIRLLDPSCSYKFTKWQTVQIQISWLLQPTDLDLHCLQRQGISGLSRTRVKCRTIRSWILSLACLQPGTLGSQVRKTNLSPTWSVPVFRLGLHWLLSAFCPNIQSEFGLYQSEYKDKPDWKGTILQFVSSKLECGGSIPQFQLKNDCRAITLLNPNDIFQWNGLQKQYPFIPNPCLAEPGYTLPLPTV